MFPPMSRREFGTIVRSNNTSGVPGVSRRIRDGEAYWSAIVHQAGGRTKKRSFSVKQWGEDTAKAKAIAARMSMLRDVPGWITHQPDTAAAGLVPPPLVVCSRAPVETDGSRRRDPSPERRVYRQPLRWPGRLYQLHLKLWFRHRAKRSFDFYGVSTNSASIARVLRNKMRRMHTTPHPGLTLRDDVLPALGMSVTNAADALGVTRQALSRVLNGAAAISPEMALRLERWLGAEHGGRADVWLGMQVEHDLCITEQKARAPINEVKPLPVSALVVARALKAI